MQGEGSRSNENKPLEEIRKRKWAIPDDESERCLSMYRIRLSTGYDKEVKFHTRLATYHEERIRPLVINMRIWCERSRNRALDENGPENKRSQKLEKDLVAYREALKKPCRVTRQGYTRHLGIGETAEATKKRFSRFGRLRIEESRLRIEDIGCSSFVDELLWPSDS
ncbi:hypothetical protein E3N88_09720 [Mikania micrantha]|uniref:Uncharacterized protein n=1 Tax=Mikania micrantha TaxID=192012 RepID=A0A5N6PJX7_9ASTR|nr:hypothetical protein E3N88_09720 [Mikania micrantha]